MAHFLKSFIRGSFSLLIVLGISIVSHAQTMYDIPDKTISVGESYSHSVDVDGFTIENLSIDPSNSWLQYETEPSPRIYGAPGNSDKGEITFTITADDGSHENTASDEVTITVVDKSPVFNSDPPTAIDEGETYTYNIDATDPDGGDITLSYERGPSWLSLSGGTLSGSPGYSGSGEYDVSIGATDVNGNSRYQNYRITVNEVNRAPSITSSPPGSVSEGSSYSYAIEASDPDGDGLTYSLVSGPSWLSMSGNTLSGTPGYNESGDYSIKIEVSDGNGGTKVQSFTVTVNNGNRAPNISSSPPESVSEGSSYSYAIEASDPDGDGLTYQLTEGPSWASISGNTISGKPGYSAAGEYDFKITVTDGNANATQSFTVVVSEADSPPKISSEPPTSAVEGQEYSYVIEANDADGDNISYSLVEGASWLTLDGNHLHGTPGDNAQGDHEIKIRVTAGGKNDTQTFTLTVDNTNQAPSIDSTPTKAGKEGSTYEYVVNASDPDGDNLSFSKTTGPDWLSFTDNTLSGKPGYNQAGEYDIEIQVSDGNATDSQSFTLTISNVNRAPNITSSPPTSATGGSKYEYVVNASDPDGDDISYSKAAGPDWLSMSGNTLSGTPGNKVSGDFDVTVKASDGNASDSQSFTITVSSTNRPPKFTSEPVTDVKKQEKYSYQVTADDPDGDDLSIAAVEKAPWMNYSDNGDGTAVLSGTPSAEQSGSYQVILRANDGTDQVDQTFEVTVQDVGRAPKITSNPPTYVQEEISYTYNIEASDPDGGTISFDYASGPGWLSLSNTDPKAGTATLTGTPPAGKSGEYTIKIVATAGEESTTQQYTLEVGTGNGPPTITSEPVEVAHVAKSYRYAIAAKDNEEQQISFTLETAPDFLSLAGKKPSAGEAALVGKPTKNDVGKHEVIIKATDDGSPKKSTQQQFTLTVSVGNAAPVFQSQPNEEVNADELYEYTVRTNDPDGDNITLSASRPDGSDLPGWLSFNDSGDGEGKLTGTPTPDNKGVTRVVIKATDDGQPKQTNEQAFDIRVNPKSVAQLNVFFVYPNACREQCKIRFAIPTEQAVHMKVYSAAGELVRETKPETYPEGVNEIEFQPKKLPSGKYSFTLYARDMSYNAEFTVIR